MKKLAQNVENYYGNMTIILLTLAKKIENNDIWRLKSDELKDGCLINKNRQPQIWQEF